MRKLLSWLFKAVQSDVSDATLRYYERVDATRGWTDGPRWPTKAERDAVWRQVEGR